MRGEHLDGIDEIDMGEGSSPHARGTLTAPAGGCCQNGIIPACAGNTPCPIACIRPYGDHPRIRGEHPAGQVPELSAQGSSPHARGTPGVDVRQWLVRGIIPACAGTLDAVVLEHGSHGIIPACAGNTFQLMVVS